MRMNSTSLRLAQANSIDVNVDLNLRGVFIWGSGSLLDVSVLFFAWCGKRNRRDTCISTTHTLLKHAFAATHALLRHMHCYGTYIATLHALLRHMRYHSTFMTVFTPVHA